MIKVLLILLLTSFIWARPLVITKEFSTQTTKAYEEILQDKKKDLLVSDILDDKYAIDHPESIVKVANSVFWSKVTLTNKTTKTVRLVFQNKRAGTDKIDVYIYKDKTLLHTHRLGDLRPQYQREHLSPKSTFFLHLEANEIKTIIGRFESMAPMNLSWQILDEKSFFKQSNFIFLFNGLFAGVLIALMIYNFVLYLSFKESTFLLYVILTFCMFWMQYTFSGMFYFLDIGLDLYLVHISAWMVPYSYSGVFMLFVIAFFKIHQKKRYVYYAFIAMSVLGFSLSLASLYMLVDPSYAIYTPYTYIYLNLALLFAFSYSIYAVIKGYPLALYFLLGYSTYIGAFFYSVLVIAGVVVMPTGFQFIVPIAMMLEVIIFSIALSKRVKQLKKDNTEQESLLIEEAKFSAIGKSIGNAAHQWKRPLSQIHTHLLYLQGLYYVGDKKRLLAEFGSNIEKVGQITSYMKNSIEELHDFYSDSETNKEFKLNKQIELAMTLQSDKLTLNNIEVTVTCDDDATIVGAKHAFANILMILFDNTIDQFEHNKTLNAHIEIRIEKIQDHTYIYFKDNAGGMYIHPLSKVFEMHFTTKGSKGSGLGLALAKKLTINGLSGNIDVKNTHDGVEFSIIV